MRRDAKRQDTPRRILDRAEMKAELHAWARQQVREHFKQDWNVATGQRLHEYLAIEERPEHDVLNEFIRTVRRAHDKAQKALRALPRASLWSGKVNGVHLPPLPPLMLEDEVPPHLRKLVILAPTPREGEWLTPIPDAPARNIKALKGARYERDRLVRLLYITDALGAQGAGLTHTAPDGAIAAVYMLLAPDSYFSRGDPDTMIARETDAIRQARGRSPWSAGDRRRGPRRRK